MRFIYFNKNKHFVLMEWVCWAQWELVVYTTYLNISLWCRCSPSISGFDSASRAHFRSESVLRFIILKRINTLYSWNECVGPNRSYWFKSLIWTYPYDADVFLQFRVLIRLLELISVRNQSWDSFILIKINTLYSWNECFGPNRS